MNFWLYNLVLGGHDELFTAFQSFNVSVNMNNLPLSHPWPRDGGVKLSVLLFQMVSCLLVSVDTVKWLPVDLEIWVITGPHLDPWLEVIEAHRKVGPLPAKVQTPADHIRLVVQTTRSRIHFIIILFNKG